MLRAPLLEQHATPSRGKTAAASGRIRLSTLFLVVNFFILLAAFVILYRNRFSIEENLSAIEENILAADKDGRVLDWQHQRLRVPRPSSAGGVKMAVSSFGRGAPASGKVHFPQAEEVKPLSGRYAALWNELKTKQQAILSLPRLATSARISCGGTETMGFRTWNEIKNGLGARLNQALPARAVSIPALTAAVKASPCWKTSTYKESGCEFVVPSAQLETEPLCAVVGNSGKLRNQNWQNEIDSCDVVIRFNNGVTEGFEKHVGTKSSIRIYNHPNVRPKQPGEITIAEMRNLEIQQWLKSFTKDPPVEALGFVMDPELICHAWDWVGRAGVKPSSGLVGIMLALKLCRHVHVFGFFAAEYFDKNAQPHYYDWERPMAGREHVHPFSQEAEVYRILQSAGKLTMHE